MLLWFGISLPLVCIGGIYGYKKAKIKNPCETYLIPKVENKTPLYLSNKFIFAIGGLFPFG